MSEAAASPEPVRRAGLERLARFVPDAGARYARYRSFDFGPGRRGNTSGLSPYLRHRLVTEVEVLQAVLQRHSRREAAKFIDEVFWRTFFKGWLEQHPSAWRNYVRSVGDCFKDLEHDPSLLERYNSATAGNTGIDCFDAWVDELVTTGYLHNPARMWFASIWIFTLELPWELGADFFLRHLVDGDPASNTCGWRWVAGLQTSGKTYLARVSNIVSCTGGRFNPRGKLATSAPPLTESNPPEFTPLPPQDSFEPDGAFALLITEEDCAPDFGLLDRAPDALLGLVATRRRSLIPVGVPAYTFAMGAVNEAVTRAGNKFNVEGGVIEADYDCDDIVEWASSKGVRSIITSYPPVGPVADYLNDADAKLRQHGIRLVRLRRRYDEICWPHANRGYFRLKKVIPRILRELGLEAIDAHPEVSMNRIEKQATAVAMKRIPR